MKTIKFRGFSNCNSEWTYGNLVIVDDEYHITDQEEYEGASDYTSVDENSVGQFTGLHDKNGTEVYEGDILAHNYGDYSLIVYREECMAFCRIDAKDVCDINGYYNLSEHAWRSCLQGARVIGNRYENPELLNCKEED